MCRSGGSGWWLVVLEKVDHAFVVGRSFLAAVLAGKSSQGVVIIIVVVFVAAGKSIGVADAVSSLRRRLRRS